MAFLSQQRDMYAYLHDQTLRLLNQGFTGLEIAEMMELPPALANAWHARGYYGSVSHNVKAVYQRYMGWFDGNPAHLWEHPPVENAQRYVECMGGASKVMAMARDYAAHGDLRFAATLLNHMVFADADNADAKSALADVYQRLGQGAENGTWRNFYLTGAMELREGVRPVPTSISGGMAAGLSIEQVSDGASGADLTLSLTRPMLFALVGGQDAAGVKTAGDGAALRRLLAVIDDPEPDFPIVTP